MRNADITPAELWREASHLSRVAIATTFIAVAMNVATYFGAFQQDRAILYAPHLVLLGLLFVVVGSQLNKLWVAHRKRVEVWFPESRVPRWLWLLALIAAANLVIVAFATSASPYEVNTTVRVFSSFWIFFGILATAAL